MWHVIDFVTFGQGIVKIPYKNFIMIEASKDDLPKCKIAWESQNQRGCQIIIK